MQKGGLVLLVLLSLVLTVGCGKAGETLAELKNDLQQDVAAPVPEQEKVLNSNEQQLVIPDMDDLTIEETYEPVQTIGSSQGEAKETVMISLYFADASGQSLIKTEKKIPKVEGLARATVEELLAGPEMESGLQSAIPSGTKLLDINVKSEEKICIVDFSKELMGKVTDDLDEEIALCSVTNTLCQFPSIEKVEFRIEGQALTTLCFNDTLVH